MGAFRSTFLSMMDMYTCLLSQFLSKCTETKWFWNISGSTKRPMKKCSNGKEGTVIGNGCLDWRVYYNLLCRWLFVWRILKIPLYDLETIVPVPQAINKSSNCFQVIALRIDDEGYPVPAAVSAFVKFSCFSFSRLCHASLPHAFLL